MYEFYKLRIDTTNRDLVHRLLRLYCGTYLLCWEQIEGANPHCHLYIQLLANEEAFRTHLRKKFGAGNGSYSLKKLSSEKCVEYLAYCMKEKDWQSSGIDQELLDEAEAYDLKIKNEIKEKKKARRTILETLEDNIDWVAMENEIKSSHLYCYEEDATVWPPYILDAVMDYYIEKKVLIRSFQVESVCVTLLLNHSEAYKKLYRKKLLNQLVTL